MSHPLTFETLGLPDTLAAHPVQESLRSEAPSGATDLDAGLELLEVIGRGGMGVVHRAHESALDRDVAVKRLRADAPADAQARLIEEARIVGALEHPSVIPVHSLRAGADGQPELVMKRVEGKSWRALAFSGEHPLRFHVETTIALTHPLELAHARGIVHRDVKPSNVMIGEFGETYLLDWGVAARVGERASGLAGTPAYMAPEMIERGEITPRTDVYLLGGSLFEALTGAPPHPGASFLDVATHALEGPPLSVGPGAPPALEAVLRRATARDPAERYASVVELREALHAFLTRQGSVALVEAASERARVCLDDAGHDETARRLAFAEARFGLQQACAIWPENPDAIELLRRLASAMITLELDGGNLEAAATLAKEHDLEDDETRAKLDAARAVARARAERGDALEREARARDLRTGERRRVRFTLLFTGGTVTATALGHVFFRSALTYPFVALQQAAISGLGALLMLVVLGRPPNRRALEYQLSLALTMGSLLLGTGVGWRLGVPVADTVFFETAGLVPVLVMITLAVDRRAWLALAVVALGVTAGLALPGWRYAAIQLAQVGGLLALLVAWVRAPRSTSSVDADGRVRREREAGAAGAGRSFDEPDAIEARRDE